jgi:hypothetical protein
MMEYRVINEVNDARGRIKHNRYNSVWKGNDRNTLDSDQLIEFTFGSQAERDSRSNFDLVLSVARQYGQSLVVFKPSQIQVAGASDQESNKAVAEALFPQAWLREYEKWVDTTYPMGPRSDQSQQGRVCEFYTYRHSLCLREHQGVYDVATGRRLTNRREIIQRMWDLGFAAHRGRPLSIARIKWTGNREELTELADLADRHWNRRNTSDAAKKLVSAWRSIARYAAWPGSW